jgi:hypothetical protein
MLTSNDAARAEREVIALLDFKFDERVASLPSATLAEIPPACFT